MNPPTPEQLLEHLTQRVQSLEQMIRDQGLLGLTQGRRFIYIQNTKRSLWAFIDTDEPVPAVALTGYVTDLYRKEDEVPKLHVVVRTREDEFVLCSGFETHFSRDVMAAIAQLTPEQAHRPLKIVPCLKELKKAEAEADKTVKKPVYANVLLDDRTIYTGQLKQQLSAEELFAKAQAVLKGITPTLAPGATVTKGAERTTSPVIQSASPSSVKPTAVPRPTPAIAKTEAPLPMVAKVETSAPVASIDSGTTASGTTALETKSPESTVKPSAIDWKSFCQQYGILPMALKALAQDLGLPMGKLNANQSARLYQQAYSRFVQGSAASA
jgi:hypothetical protein